MYSEQSGSSVLKKKKRRLNKRGCGGAVEVIGLCDISLGTNSTTNNNLCVVTRLLHYYSNKYFFTMSSIFVQLLPRMSDDSCFM